MASPAISKPTATWKRFALFGLFAGAGFALVTAAIVGAFVLYRSRPKPPKPWDESALSAAYYNVQRTDQVGFVYELTNNTDTDYRLNDPREFDLMFAWGEGNHLISTADTSTVVTLVLPVYIPARHTAFVSIQSHEKYPVKEKTGATKEEDRVYGEEMEKWMAKRWAPLNGFELFDPVRRYKIHFPAGWKQATAETKSK